MRSASTLHEVRETVSEHLLLAGPNLLAGESIMAFVVCEPCRDCKYTDCVVVCPCDCFYQDDSMLYIDAEHCIDFEACLPECPVEAIFPDVQVPVQWTHYIQLNAERALALRAAGVGPITERQEPKAKSSEPLT